MYVAWAATAHTTAYTIEFCIHRGGIGACLFVANVNPPDPAVPPYRIVYGVQTITGYGIQSFNTCIHEVFYQ